MEIFRDSCPCVVTGDPIRRVVVRVAHHHPFQLSASANFPRADFLPGIGSAAIFRLARCRRLLRPDGRPASRPVQLTSAQKRKPTMPRIYNLSGRPALAAVT
jgi:hypothetical protein